VCLGSGGCQIPSLDTLCAAIATCLGIVVGGK